MRALSSHLCWWPWAQDSRDSLKSPAQVPAGQVNVNEQSCNLGSLQDPSGGGIRFSVVSNSDFSREARDLGF